MKKKIIIIFIILAICILRGSLIKAENLLPNGSFEITTVPDIPDCWDQYLGPKKIKNWYFLWKIAKNIAFHGKNSLCIKVPFYSFRGKLYAESCFGSTLIRRAKLKKIRKDRYYTLSLYLKSDREHFPVRIFFQTNHFIKIGRKWKRYFFTSYIESSDKLKRVRITPLGVGKLWIDAVQLEEGITPTQFAPSPYDSCFGKLPKPKKVRDVQNELSRLGWKRNLNFSELKFNPSKKIDIDPTRRIILIDGKPFFFFAACFMTAHLFKKRWLELFDILKKHGYTVVIASFSCSWNDSHASLEEVKRFLNIAYQYDIKVIIWIDPNAIRKPDGRFIVLKKETSPEITLKNYKSEIQKMIPPLKNHPAILGWYLFDEPRIKEIKIGLTKKLIDFARKLDKVHLLYINYGNLKADYKFYQGKIPGDLVSQTQYPIPIYPITYIAEHTGMEYIAGEFKKPVVLWLQLYSGSDRGRNPTPDEFTCMTYLAAIYGATGFQTWPMMPGSKLLWDAVKKVIAEMKELAPVLYEPVRIPIEVKGSEYVHAMAKKVNGKYWIIAVNTLDKPQKVIVKLPINKNIRYVKVKFEDNRIINPTKNLFKDFFKPYQRHVYMLSVK